MGIIFLICALLKGAYSLFNAFINCKNLFNQAVKLSDESNDKLAALIKYRFTLLSIEIFGTGITLVPLILGVQDTNYLLSGFAVWFATGAIEDFTEILTCRWEQRRRKER